MNIIICENIESLLVYSALEQFTDSPVFQSSYPQDSVLDIYWDTSIQEYDLLMSNFYEYFKCTESGLPTPPGSGCPFVLPKEDYEFLLQVYRQEIADIDGFFERNATYKNFQDIIYIPNALLEFANIDNGKSVYHFILEREEWARYLFRGCIFVHQAHAPYVAEALNYRLDHSNPSFDDLWFYIIQGLETKDHEFYLNVARDFVEQTDLFQMDFIRENGWRYEEQYFKIYELAVEKKNQWCIPFDVAFQMAFKEYLYATMHLHVVWSVIPERFCLDTVEGRDDFIQYFYFHNTLYNYFFNRRQCEDLIYIMEYLMNKCNEEYCEGDSPFCFWNPTFPFSNLNKDYNSSFMGPLALTGALYCQKEENINYLLAIYESCFNDLCNFESIRNAAVPVIFFSMGRLYVFTVLSSFLFLLLYFVFCFKMYIVLPNMYQMFFESIYNFVFNIVSEQAGILAVVHFPLVFSIFNVILCGNIVGLIPYGFTVTSHLTFTFSLGLFVFIGIVLLTILNKRIEFLRLFIPTGVPKLLVPLLCVIEVISYVFRVVSLSVRLFANMMAGHALLHILLGFVPVIFNFKNIVRFLFVFPIAIIIMITLLEIGISLLQSYVFIVLISIYLRDCYGASAH